MRDVEVVKETRNALRNELASFMRLRREMQDRKKNFGEYDEKMYVYSMKTIEKINIQINALEFILNEDTEIKDSTFDTHYNTTYGINKEKAMEYLSK